MDIKNGHIFEIWKRMMERRLHGLQNKTNIHFYGLCGPGLHSNVTEQFGRSDSNESALKFNQEGCWVVENMSYSRGMKYLSGMYIFNCALASSERVFFNSVSQGRFTFM